MANWVSRALTFGQFLHRLKLAVQLQAVLKFREGSDTLVPDLEAPLIITEPEADDGCLTLRVVDRVVKHLRERISGDPPSFGGGW